MNKPAALPPLIRRFSESPMVGIAAALAAYFLLAVMNMFAKMLGDTTIIRWRSVFTATSSPCSPFCSGRRWPGSAG